MAMISDGQSMAAQEEFKERQWDDGVKIDLFICVSTGVVPELYTTRRYKEGCTYSSLFVETGDVTMHSTHETISSQFVFETK